MRNTTYIKTLLAALAIAMPLQAQSAPPQGCFTRDYSDAHLAATPDQLVDKIRLGFIEEADGLIANMWVLLADQGRARQSGLGGQGFEQTLYCFADEGAKQGWRCSVECDGGSLQITRDDGKLLEFKTRYLIVGETEGCAGAIDLAEVQDEWVTYRLHRVENSQCGIK